MKGKNQKAPEEMMVGYGEGLDPATDYMVPIPGKWQKTTFYFYSNALGYHYFQSIEEMPWYDKHFSEEVLEADDRIVYLSQKQGGMSPSEFEYVAGHQPEYTVVINGIKYARIYNLA